MLFRSGMGLGANQGNTGECNDAAVSEADRVLWPGSLSRWGQATSTAPFYVPPPSPVSFNGRSSEDYTWAVALSTYDHLEIESAKHATSHLTSWAVAYDADRKQRREDGRDGGAAAAMQPPNQETAALSTTDMVVGGWGNELLSPVDDRSSLSGLSDIMPGLVGLGE